MVERIRTLLETRQLTPTQFADAIGIARPIVSHILSGRNKPSLEVVQRILAAMPDISMPWLLNGSGPMLATAPAPKAAGAQALPLPAPPPPAEPALANTAPLSQPNGSLAGAALAVPAAAVAPIQKMVNTSLSDGIVSDSQPVPGRSAPVAAGGRPAPKRFAPTAPKVTAEPAQLSEPASAGEAPVSDASTAPTVAEASSVAAKVQTTPETTSQATPFAGAAALFGGEKPIRRIVIFYRDGSFADYQPE